MARSRLLLEDGTSLLLAEDGASALLLEYVEEIEPFTGTDGATVTNAYGIFDGGGDGTGSWVLENAFTAGVGYQGSKVTVTTSSAFNRIINFPKLISEVWITLKFSYDTLPSSNIAILQLRSSSTIRAEVQLRNGTGTLRMRNATSVVGSNFTNGCGAGSAYYLSWHITQANQSLYLYDSTGSLIESQTGQTYDQGTFDNFSFGVVNAPGLATVAHFARPGYNTLDEIPPPSGGTVSADSSATATFAGISDAVKALAVSGADTAVFAGSADAARTTPVTATSSVTFAGGADATLTKGGAATAAASFTASGAVALSPGVVTGTGGAAFAGTASATVVHPVTGSSAATFTGTAAATVFKAVDGAATSSFTATAVAAAVHPVTGTGSAAFAGTTSATVTHPVGGAGSATFTGAADALNGKVADATTTATFTGTAVVTVTRTVTGSASAVFAGAAQVVLVRNAQASAQAAFAATATAAKPAARYRGWGLPL